MQHIHILQNYQQRLTNLSSKNRTLKLLKPVKAKDLDFFNFAYEAQHNGHIDLLQQLIAYKKITLIPQINPHDEKTNALDRQLTLLYRTLNTLESETGLYPLKVGYPFVEGKFTTGHTARCPLILFPYYLQRQLSNQNRWALIPMEGEEPHWNLTFFLALQQFQQIKLPIDFWETEIPNEPDFTAFLHWLFNLFKTHNLPIKWNTDIIEQPYKMFSSYLQSTLDNYGLGELFLQPEALLGLFPEAETALFEDYKYLIENAQHLKNHSAFQFTTQSVEEQKEIIVPVLPIDYSQEQVLLQAFAGHNLAVQGPPGTGKSQLIINFIASQIQQGKSILVVCQKKAALDVIYNRMQSIGLQSLCSLIHDPYADKANLYKQWNQLLQQLASFTSQNHLQNQFHEQLLQFQELLNYFKKNYDYLFDTKPFGISLSELYLQTQTPQKIWNETFLNPNFTFNEWKNLKLLLAEIAEYKHLFNEQNTWFFRKNLANYAYHEVLNFLELLQKNAQALLQQLQSVAFKGYYLMEITNLYEIIQDYFKLNELFKQSPDSLLFYQFLNEDPQSIAKAKQLLNQYHQQKQNIDTFTWLPHALKEGLTTIQQNLHNYHELKSSFFRFLNPDWWYLKKYFNNFFQKFHINFDSYNLQQWEQQLQQYLDFQNFVQQYPWTQLPKEALDFCIEFFNRRIFSELKPTFSNGKLNQEHWQQSLNYFQNLKQVKQNWEEAIQQWQAYLHHRQIQEILTLLSAAKNPDTFITPLINDFKTLGHDLLQLDKIMAKIPFSQAAILENALAILPNYTNTEAWLNEIQNQIFFQWIQKLEKIHPDITALQTKSHEKKWNYLRKVYQELMTLNAQIILQQYQQTTHQAIQANEKVFKEISYQTQKKRKLWSVRQMVENYWDKGLRQLAPLWLTSPEGAAAIFPLTIKPFDWIIFDEASQCYVEKAIPLLFRTNNTIVIGDTKQLQPFNLYEIKISSDDNDAETTEEEILFEIESLLHFAEQNYKNTKLLWHYRSQQKSLIQFSNQHFYDSELQFVPSPFPDANFTPEIQWIKVNGTWHQNTNELEAQQVINILHEQFIQKKLFPSIGIITFNYHQQQLILDLMEQKVQNLKDPEESLAWHQLLENDGIEKLFVKNIENVQGDERDVIIFSVAYAPNKEGKFIQQFGSLSQQGGENRLNVAVSRARKKIILISSIEPEQLHDNLSSQGAKLLKQYLAFVKHHAQLAHNHQHHYTPSAMAQQLFNYFNQFPEYDCFFPHENIDLAVHDKQNQITYAILCEDGVLKQKKNAIEPFLYLPNLLHAKGWIPKIIFAQQLFYKPQNEWTQFLQL